MDGQGYCQMWNQLGASACVDNWKNLFQECADWCLPRKDNILKVTTEGTEKPVQRMIDTCIEANYNFATGFYSRMFPTGSIWGKFKHPKPAMMAIPAVAEYFEECSRIIHGVLTESNFTQETQESLMDIGCFGTNCIYVEPDADNVVNFRSFTVGSIRIGLNNKGRVDTVGLEVKLNSRQMVQEFGEEALAAAELAYIKDEIAAQKSSDYTIYHLVFPRKDYDATRTDSRNMPFASVKVCTKNKKVITEKGYPRLPYFVGRFSVGNNNTYGTSPMMMILGTARRTNVIYRSLITTAELNANPQWLVPDDDSVSGLSNRAGSVIKWRATNPNGAPQRLQDNGNPMMAKEVFDGHDDLIRRAFFNHLFRPLDEYRNMTAYEVNVRQSTDLMALTPFAGRYYDEVVSPLLSYVFYLCDKAGVLPEPPQELLADQQFKIEYLGQLSLATMSFETTGSFSTMNMFAEISRYVPAAAEVFRNIDFDKLMRQTWYNNNGSMTALRSDKDVKEERAAEQQAQAQQAQQQAMMNAAQAASMGSQTPQPGSPTAKIMESQGV
jgi:hypothetical protein